MAKLHFYYSAMNAGKSTTLLQSSYNYQERGMQTILLLPDIDTRSGRGTIGSRIGLQEQAHIFSRQENLFDKIISLYKNNGAHCVLIDEAHFLTKDQVKQLCFVCDELNIPVLAYGLRTDFQAQPFDGSMHLLALADVLVELKTICHCGAKATMNMRIDTYGNKIEEGEQIAIGGNEMYVATCRKHFFLGESGVENMRKTQHKAATKIISENFIH